VYELRAQQVVFEDAIRDAFRRVRCVLATAPTGFGKGVVIGDAVFPSRHASRKWGLSDGDGTD